MNTNTSTLANQITELLRRLLSEIIMHPDKLRIQAVPMARSVTVYIQASGPDTPRIIGTGGAHYRALAAIAGAIGRKHGIAVELDKLAEPADRERGRYPEFVGKENWASAKVLRLLMDTALEVFTDEQAVDVNFADGPGPHCVSTNIDLLVSREEAPQVVAEMGAALPALFKSIGKMNGRRLFLNVVASQPPTRQPESAAGRFSR